VPVETINGYKGATYTISQSWLNSRFVKYLFWVSSNARRFLNSVFLHHCLKAGMTSVIINVKHIIPLSKMTQEDIEICEELLFTPDDNSLFKFIEHFSDTECR